VKKVTGVGLFAFRGPDITNDKQTKAMIQPPHRGTTQTQGSGGLTFTKPLLVVQLIKLAKLGWQGGDSHA